MRRVLFLCPLFFFILAHAAGQTLEKSQRESVRVMARQVWDAIRKNYYDPELHGLDLEARFKAADERIKLAANLGQAFGAIAEALDPLRDSHTFFVPPSRAMRRETGYRWGMVGEAAYITAVKPGSDAATKLGPGDQLVLMEKFHVTRKNSWKLGYSLNTLYALPAMRLGVRKPDGSEAIVEVAAKVDREKRILDLNHDDDVWQIILQSESEDRMQRQRYIELGEAMIWKMPQFDMAEGEVAALMQKARAHKSLILDLRGNPGGYVKTLEAVAGSLVAHDVTIAARKGRKADLKPIVAISQKGSAFSGKLVVLIDARSSSAAELLARVTQLEKRGVVVGDRSAGAVMEARYFSLSHGADVRTLYGVSVTDADLVMQDGKSLEHEGVMPDELILPTTADLVAGRDPALAKAAELAGLKLDSTAAGKLFPLEWR